MKKVAVSVVAFLALAGVVGFLAKGGFSGSPTNGGGGGGGGGGGASVVGAGAVPAGVPAGEGGLSSAPAANGDGGIETLGQLPAIGPDIVKTAELSVVVKKGTFTDMFGQATFVARRYGGYVESSSTAGTKSKSGSLQIRIPNASFEQALADLKGLGQVDGLSISGQDVTAAFVDLDARLRTWEAQESVLLKLMQQANSIEETLRVQNQLQDVQFRIEQIRGQLRVLGNQVDLATIRIRMREAGAPVRLGAVSDRPSLSDAWNRAVDGLLGVVYAVVVGLGYLVPLAILTLAGTLVYRRLRPAAAPAKMS